MATIAGAVAFIAGLAAEYRSAVVLSAVVTTETSFPAFLIRPEVLFDLEQRRRRPVIAAVDRVASRAIVVDIAHMRFVGEQRAVRAAGIFRGERLCIQLRRRMTHNAV